MTIKAQNMLSEKTAKQLQTLLATNEGGPGGNQKGGGKQFDAVRITVTSGAPIYQGVVTQFDTTANDWVDFGDIYVMALNDETLEVDKRYFGYRYGTVSGSPLFFLQD